MYEKTSQSFRNRKCYIPIHACLSREVENKRLLPSPVAVSISSTMGAHGVCCVRPTHRMETSLAPPSTSTLRPSSWCGMTSGSWTSARRRSKETMMALLSPSPVNRGGCSSTRICFMSRLDLLVWSPHSHLNQCAESKKIRAVDHVSPFTTTLTTRMYPAKHTIPPLQPNILASPCCLLYPMGRFEHRLLQGLVNLKSVVFGYSKVTAVCAASIHGPVNLSIV